MELGCDARGHSRAGNDTVSWYCVILAGRLSPELNKMREWVGRGEGIQERLSIDSELSEADKEQSSVLADALKSKRLTFAWLDGEAQEDAFTGGCMCCRAVQWKSAPWVLCDGINSSAGLGYGVHNSASALKVIVKSNRFKNFSSPAIYFLLNTTVGLYSILLPIVLPDTPLQLEFKFLWIQKYCSYYLHSETVYDTCGPRRDLNDVPKLFIVRYKRNASENDVKVETKPKNIFNMFEDENADTASQLVARYNGSDETPQLHNDKVSIFLVDLMSISGSSPVFSAHVETNMKFFTVAPYGLTVLEWKEEREREAGEIVLINFVAIVHLRSAWCKRSKTPDLVPEDSEPIWSRGAQSIFSKGIGIKQRIYNNINRIYDYLGDPRIGPILLLGALISSGTIWLIRSQSTHPSHASQLSKSNTKVHGMFRYGLGQDGAGGDGSGSEGSCGGQWQCVVRWEDETRARRRDREKHTAKKDRPPSITDSEPKGAYQMPLSDSESE
ncbi:unnamed protein product [Dovyalis caffra]|uniref:Uncharacterized protein n=1 Tax=Dovyalis caffra TaxID=77055 RepID=A0AAV1S225_9ROSI|nr:unnamed protein product [Dovyalis caffra]